jgi:hypothetical protein
MSTGGLVVPACGSTRQDQVHEQATKAILGKRISRLVSATDIGRQPQSKWYNA